MSNCQLYKDTFDVKRLTEDGSDKESYASHLTSQKGFFQPADENFTGEQDLDRYILYTSRIDIRETDRIVYNSENYMVAEKKDYNFGKSRPHLRILLNKE